MPSESSIEPNPPTTAERLPFYDSILSGWRPYLILGLLTLLFWARTLSYEFVWDDFYFIVNNKAAHSLKNIPAMFTSLKAQSSYPEGFVLYRPLRTLHYALLVALGGGSPKPALFHLANVLWHDAATILLFSCARNLLRRFVPSEGAIRADIISFALTLGFAIHPVVTEVVAWAKSLDDLMATVFTLASLRLLLSVADARRAVWGALGFFLLALFSKESAVPFAAAALLILWLIRKQSFKDAALQSAPFFAAAALFMLIRHEVIGRTSQAAPISGTYAQTLIDTVPAAVTYLRLLWGVPPFAIDYDFMSSGNSVSNPQVLAGLILIVALLATVACCLRNERWRPVGFGFAWFALFMLPVSNIVPMMQYMAERFLYLPMIGWFLAIGAILLYVPRARVVGIVSVLLLGCWSAFAWQRAAIWHDPATLFVTSMTQGPRTKRIEDNVVAAVLRQPHMQRVFQVQPPIPGQLPRIALRNAVNTNWTDIVETLNDLSHLLPNHPSVNSAQGIAWALQGQPAQAATYFQKVTEANPRDPAAWANLGRALADSNRPDDARKALERALELSPNNLSALHSLSSLLWQKEDFAAALPLFERLMKLEPQNPEHARWAKEARERLERSKP